jgi:hypothetical protein
MPDQVIYTQPSVTSLSKWTIDGINCALEEHDQGYFYTSAQLVDGLLRRTGRYQTAMMSRIRGVLGLPFRMDPAKEPGDVGKRRGAKQQRIAREWEDQWGRSVFVRQRGRAALDESAIGQVMHAGLSLGAGLAQVIPEARGAGGGSRWWPRLQPWSSQWLHWRDDTKTYWVHTNEGPVEIIPGEGKWLLYTPYGYEGGWLDAPVRSLAHVCLISSWNWRDWARFSEKHGLAMLLAKIPSGVDEKDKTYRAFLGSLRKLGRETTILAPQGDKPEKSYSAELLEAKADTSRTFRELKSFCDSEITLVIKGENLTTEVKEGSFAAAKEHGGGKQDVLEADVDGFCTPMRDQVVAPYTAYNEGNAELAPWPVLDYAPPEDKKQRADITLVGLQAIKEAKAQGLKLDVKTFCEKLDIPLNLAGEDDDPFEEPAEQPALPEAPADAPPKAKKKPAKKAAPKGAAAAQ